MESVIYLENCKRQSDFEQSDFEQVGDSVVERFECLHSTAEVTSLNLSLGASSWKVGSYLPVPEVYSAES